MILKIRTIQQNKYYWGIVVDCLAIKLKMEPLELHEVLKYKFLPQGVDSTKKLNTIAFNLYFESIRQWAGNDLNLFIPLPNE